MLVFPWSLESYERKKGRYILGKSYKHMKEILRKYWYRKRSLGLYKVMIILN